MSLKVEKGDSDTVNICVEHVTMNVTIQSPSSSDIDQIKLMLAQVLHKQDVETITDMATNAEVVALLGRLNAATNDVASDLQELLNKPEVPEEIRAGLESAVTRLEGMAGAYPPVPVEPGETPGGSDETPVEPEGEETPTDGSSEGGSENPPQG